MRAPGFFLGYLDDGLLLTLMGEGCTAELLDTYLKEMKHGIDLMTSGANITSIHVIGSLKFTLRTLMSLTRMPYPSAVEPNLERALKRLERLHPPDRVAKWRTQLTEIVAQWAPDVAAIGSHSVLVRGPHEDGLSTKSAGPSSVAPRSFAALIKCDGRSAASPDRVKRSARPTTFTFAFDPSSTKTKGKTLP